MNWQEVKYEVRINNTRTDVTSTSKMDGTIVFLRFSLVIVPVVRL